MWTKSRWVRVVGSLSACLILRPGVRSPPSPGSPGPTCTQSSSLWTNHSYMNHTQGFSTHIRASLWIPAHSIIQSNNQRNTHAPTSSIPEIACIICFVIISLSSSDRCALLSGRAGGACGAVSCLPAGSLFASSCCRRPASLASPDDTSRAINSANTTMTFPDMTVYRKRKVIYLKGDIKVNWINIYKKLYARRLLSWFLKLGWRFLVDQVSWTANEALFY